jgi:hypothetical protein
MGTLQSKTSSTKVSRSHRKYPKLIEIKRDEEPSQGLVDLYFDIKETIKFIERSIDAKEKLELTEEGLTRYILDQSTPVSIQELALKFKNVLGKGQWIDNDKRIAL